jgi:hypothetical protein
MPIAGVTASQITVEPVLVCEWVYDADESDSPAYGDLYVTLNDYDLNEGDANDMYMVGLWLNSEYPSDGYSEGDYAVVNNYWMRLYNVFTKSCWYV